MARKYRGILSFPTTVPAAIQGNTAFWPLGDNGTMTFATLEANLGNQAPIFCTLLFRTVVKKDITITLDRGWVRGPPQQEWSDGLFWSGSVEIQTGDQIGQSVFNDTGAVAATTVEVFIA